MPTTGWISSPPPTPRAARRVSSWWARCIGLRVWNATTVSHPRSSKRAFNCSGVCRSVAREHGLRSILNGTNTDDMGDWRPGLRAADQAGVRSPLLEAGLDKQDVRVLARHLGLPNWDKPALACLSSRFPYGTRITPERLTQVGRCEQVLRDLGFRVYRVRYHGSVARLEVAPEELQKLWELKCRLRRVTWPAPRAQHRRRTDRGYVCRLSSVGAA